MSFNITDKVWWVGMVDWELWKFHGEEYTMQRGASHSAHLVRDEGVFLGPYKEEFVANLRFEQQGWTK
ncbi:hypothetical protein SAMN04489760_10385 [Syntrophus gentianae]|uniref:Uncharacterized protein n=1 Tax=Syntrophus gentianae TaxID=43775 RepID=A0A1H7V8F2_9BACT|nr:hypothetical protein SAMN04489760_10385 [Syntrophus gentianae]